MKRIDELEREIGLQIKFAQEGKDWAKVTNLGILGQELKKAKEEIERIEKVISAPQVLPLEGKSVEVEITKGALSQNYLPLTKMKKNNLLPTDGKSFFVETSVGFSFSTEITGNMLSARGKTREFYEKIGIRAGDKIIWRQIDPYKYHLSKL
ncbi:MAG: hypothetical protein ABSF79_08630 [Smithellaceae bacterium]|jgi:hypothetical protein